MSWPASWLEQWNLGWVVFSPCGIPVPLPHLLGDPPFCPPSPADPKPDVIVKVELEEDEDDEAFDPLLVTQRGACELPLLCKSLTA